MKLAQVKGVAEILSNMKKADKTIGDLIAKGLKKAGQYLQKESQAVVPVHLGNLKGSAFTRAFNQGVETDVVVGYTAAYAVYVHEELENVHGREFNIKYSDKIAASGKTVKKGKNAGKTVWKAKDYWHPRGDNQTAKFLERPAREKRTEIIRIIVSETLKG